MPFPRQYVDALLINWGDRLFHEPLRHVRARICPAWHCRAMRGVCANDWL